MNMLNSLIVEGTVKSELNYTSDSAWFEIETVRHYKKADGTMKDESSVFPVEVYGSSFVDMLRKHVYKERGIRVVGKLKQKKWTDETGRTESKVVIIAEHVEFKPSKKAE